MSSCEPAAPKTRDIDIIFPITLASAVTGISWQYLVLLICSIRLSIFICGTTDWLTSTSFSKPNHINHFDGTHWDLEELATNPALHKSLRTCSLSWVASSHFVATMPSSKYKTTRRPDVSNHWTGLLDWGIFLFWTSFCAFLKNLHSVKLIKK